MCYISIFLPLCKLPSNKYLVIFLFSHLHLVGRKYLVNIYTDIYGSD